MSRTPVTPVRASVRRLLTVASLLGLAGVAGGCAAPASDESVDDADQASSVAAADADLAALKLDFRGRRLAVVDAVPLGPMPYPFDASNRYAAFPVGRARSVQCWAIVKTAGTGSRTLVRGTIYTIDATKITRTMEPTAPWQRVNIPLTNDVGLEPKGTASDWELVCWAQTTVEMRSIDDALDSEYGRMLTVMR
jgi:hypothetical protein